MSGKDDLAGDLWMLVWRWRDEPWWKRIWGRERCSDELADLLLRAYRAAQVAPARVPGGES